MTRNTIIAVAIILFTAGVAHADVPPANVSQCGGKAAGDACTSDDGKSGACQDSTCTRGGGVAPDGTRLTSTGPCRVCVAGAAVQTKSKRGCNAGGANVGSGALALLAALLVRRARRSR